MKAKSWKAETETASCSGGAAKKWRHEGKEVVAFTPLLYSKSPQTWKPQTPSSNFLSFRSSLNLIQTSIEPTLVQLQLQKRSNKQAKTPYLRPKVSCQLPAAPSLSRLFRSQLRLATLCNTIMVVL